MTARIPLALPARKSRGSKSDPQLDPTHATLPTACQRPDALLYRLLTRAGARIARPDAEPRAHVRARRRVAMRTRQSRRAAAHAHTAAGGETVQKPKITF